MRVPARPGPGDHAGHGRTGDGVKRAGPSSRRELAGLLEVRNQSSLPSGRRRGRLREGLGEAARPWRFTNPSRVRGRGAGRRRRAGCRSRSRPTTAAGTGCCHVNSAAMLRGAERLVPLRADAAADPYTNEGSGRAQRLVVQTTVL